MRLEKLFYYPVKALRGIELTQAVYDGHGLVGDRQYILARPDGTMLTRRSHPGLAEIWVDVTENHLQFSNSQNSVHIDLFSHGNTVHEINVWKRVVKSYTVSDVADQFFSDYLGETVRLFSFMAEDEREAGFRDSRPMLIINLSSVRELEQISRQIIDVRRFRPNIITDTGIPFSEMKWKSLTIGDQQYRIEKPCTRCVIINQNPDSGKTDSNLLRTLADLPANNHIPLFGQYISPEQLSGRLNTGDPIRVLK
jgi:uncharacterized protein YcbX